MFSIKITVGATVPTNFFRKFGHAGVVLDITPLVSRGHR